MLYSVLLRLIAHTGVQILGGVGDVTPPNI